VQYVPIAVPMSDVTLDVIVARIEAMEQQILETSQSTNSALDTSWVFQSAILVLLMQIGFAMLESGIVREQNVVTTYAKNLLDVTFGVFCAFLGGYNLAYPALGDNLHFASADRQESLFFHLTFQATTATIVSGAMAERTGLWAYLAFSVLISSVIYPLGVRCCWGGGFLSELSPPFHDFAGSGVVHVVGGTAALVGCICVGARAGRWDPIMQPQFVPHNVPSAINGTFMLWVGWYGFNPGSQGGISSGDDRDVVSNVFVTTTFAAASSAVIILVAHIARHRGVVDVLAVCNGILSGLVSITAGCDVVDPHWAMVVGVVAGVNFMWSSRVLRCLHIDDVVDAVPVHAVGGLWGLIAVGLFHREQGLIMGHTDLLLSQLAGAGTLIAMSSSISLIFCSAAKYSTFLRVTAEQEVEGLDSKWNIHAYEHSAKAMVQYRAMHKVLQDCNQTPEDCIETLQFIKTIISRPFSPHAADNKLHGETQDILDMFEYSPNGVDFMYLSFLSHKKANGGEVGRILVDNMRRLLLSPETCPARAVQVVQQMRPENLVFFDSTNLKDLDKLSDHVAHSLNHLLLLTAGVLERPWVLAEIIKAVKLRKNFVCIMVDWPDKARDIRQFRFPDEIDSSLSRWKLYARNCGSSPTRVSDGCDTSELLGQHFAAVPTPVHVDESVDHSSIEPSERTAAHDTTCDTDTVWEKESILL